MVRNWSPKSPLRRKPESRGRGRGRERSGAAASKPQDSDYQTLGVPAKAGMSDWWEDISHTPHSPEPDTLQENLAGPSPAEPYQYCRSDSPIRTKAPSSPIFTLSFRRRRVTIIVHMFVAVRISQSASMRRDYFQYRLPAASRHAEPPRKK